MLSPLGDILVMAPDSARSGSACAITSHDPLRYRVVAVRPGIKICACSGTPVDCVKLALEWKPAVSRMWWSVASTMGTILLSTCIIRGRWVWC